MLPLEPREAYEVLCPLLHIIVGCFKMQHLSFNVKGRLWPSQKVVGF